MRKYTLLRQLVHDVINTLSCLLFETDSMLAMECVYQLRLFQVLSEISDKEKPIEEFTENYSEEIRYFTKEYTISIDFTSKTDFMKQIVIFLLLNKKSCSLTVLDDEVICENSRYFNQEIFETDNGILNHINFSENFIIKKNNNSFSILKRKENPSIFF